MICAKVKLAPSRQQWPGWIRLSLAGFVIALLATVVAGCGHEKADEQEALVNTVEVTREVIVVVTATPTSTTEPPTAIPTEQGEDEGPAAGAVALLPTPTSTPDEPLPPTVEPFIVPLGWQRYDMIGDDVSFWYPPEWTKKNEGANTIEFVRAGGDGLLVVLVDNRNLAAKDYKDKVNALKSVVLSVNPSDLDVSFFRDGEIAAAYNPVYVTASLTKRSISGSSITSYATDGEQVLAVMMVKGVPSISDADIETIGQIVRSAVFDLDGTFDVVLAEEAEQETTPGTPTTAAEPSVAQQANLRGGPGTDYPVVGSLAPGEAIRISGRNEAEDWFELATSSQGVAWIAGFLVANAPEPDEIPLSANIPPAPIPEPSPPEASGEASVQPSEQNQGSSIKGIGEEVEGNGWKFKVVEVHKRKTLYWWDESVVAFGHYLVLIIDDFNMQSGTDYFARNLKPWITNDAAQEFLESSKATRYAAWQFGGLGTMYSDLNPGQWGRIVIAYDLPDDIGHVLLSTGIPAWVDLGDFSAMPVEE